MRHHLVSVGCAALIAATTFPVFALSEIRPNESAPPADPDVIQSVPLPPPVGVPSSPPTAPADDALPGENEGLPPAEDDSVEPDAEETIRNGLSGPDASGPLPEVLYDTAQLPEPVRRMHGLILEAAKSGDIEKLRPLVGTGNGATQLSFGDAPTDPIAFLKEVSGDENGQEILAILSEVLEAGYVHLDAGDPEELYVWPYFFAVPLDRLTPPQRVELFRLVTAGDYEEMKGYGAYIFYRIGITPEGRWAFFVAGD